MTTKTGAELLVECLAIQKAKHIFGIPGESYLAVLDALHGHNSLEFKVARQEGGAAMMADAYGKLTGRPGICMVTRGPGATNASAGVHVAFQDSTPMILFIGQVARNQVDREAFQEIDYRRMFGQMAKWVAQIDDAARIPEYIARAYRVALSGRPGPVVLALPEDMLCDEVQVPDQLPGYIDRAHSAPSSQALDQFRDLVSAAKKPFLIVGGGGWSIAACDAAQDFAQNNGIPVGVSFRCQDYINNDHPNYAGHVGIGIDPGLAAKIKESDCLIVVGARLGEMTTSGYSLIESPIPSQKLIHVHAAPEEPGHVYQPDLAIACNHETAMQAFASLGLIRKDIDSDHVISARKNFEAFNTTVITSPGDVQMGEIIKYIDANTPDDVVITNGAGNYAIWHQRFLRFRGYRTQLAPTSGSMGYGLPAAVAAGLENPDRTVICFAGDGCFQMTCQEFSTAVQHGSNIKVIIVNNGMYGTIRMHQERDYPSRVSGTDIVNPDFVGMACAMGGHAELVTKTDQFAKAFQRMIDHNGPALIEIQIDPQALTPGKTLDDFRAGK
ncbi:MAG: thiamine pyrophosphate-binding protein [Cohaesibacteraceae bacterium]|nr:thiamine pyrophosphate-binding protein [Cohaesibacteraceae bacterium]MBL4875968.1 thiamine pyrophosphate-binding protein [Cohaesibacteraceae bacterium]